MNDLTLTSTRADADALEAVKNHHAQLAGALKVRVGAVLDAAAVETPAMTSLHHRTEELADWCEAELVPHALAEEKVLYAAGLADPSTKMLVEAMIAEHKVIIGLVGEVRAAATPPAAAGAARALQVLFETHLTKENDQLLPVLVADPAVSVADLLAGMHELLGGSSDEAEAAHGHSTDGHACTCGEHDQAGYPELDARAIPHAIRHSTIFGALAAVAPGGGMILVAPHDPLPLLAQIEAREPGAIEVSYLEQGPEAWRLSLVRRTR